MADICHIPFNVFSPMAEPVMWTEDASPHRRGTFDAVVLHGGVSTGAGDPVSAMFADAWTVDVPDDVAIAADIRCGDTITRDGCRLTVQKITRNDDGWILVCTSDERGVR